MWRWIVIAMVACGGSSRTPPISNRTSAEPRSQAGDKTGIQGVVVDVKNAEPLAGVTVIAVSPVAPHTEAAITDEHGAYKVVLVPGDYTVQFYYLEEVVSRHIHVDANVMTPVFIRMKSN